jgi:hypothetical protein
MLHCEEQSRGLTETDTEHCINLTKTSSLETPSWRRKLIAASCCTSLVSDRHWAKHLTRDTHLLRRTEEKETLGENGGLPGRIKGYLMNH